MGVLFFLVTGSPPNIYLKAIANPLGLPINYLQRLFSKLPPNLRPKSLIIQMILAAILNLKLNTLYTEVIVTFNGISHCFFTSSSDFFVEFTD